MIVDGAIDRPKLGEMRIALPGDHHLARASVYSEGLAREPMLFKSVAPMGGYRDRAFSGVRLDQPPTLMSQGKTVQKGDHPLVLPVTCLPADSQNPKRNV